ncbi:MAG: NYN domain-containing protein [Planctomycetaceae bacterium]|nr:NYN domain-containing protein [Planctomycetaceae bacterium]
MPVADESLIAVFVDFENLALGVKDMHLGEVKIQLVLKRLLEKGRLVFKRAYCDWTGYGHAVREFHGHGIELIDVPHTRQSGKNSADIRMVVDALDLCYSKNHIDTFALLSGDSDFSPLVSKLKENNKRVIGCGVKNSTSDMLIANCDEFIYYDDLVRMVQKARAARPQQKPKDKDAPKDKDRDDADKKQEAIEWLCEIVRSQQADYESLWGSQVKQTIRRVHPGFNEAYYGYKSFTELIKDAESRGLLRLEYDEARGNFKVKLKEE